MEILVNLFNTSTKIFILFLTENGSIVSVLLID